MVDPHYLDRTKVAQDVIFAGSNGFYYSIPSGIGIIKNCSFRHTAAFFDGNSLKFPETGFSDRFIANWSIDTIEYQFFIIKDSLENVLQLANIINTYPIGVI